MSDQDKQVPAEFKEAVSQVRSIAEQIDGLKADLRDGSKTNSEYQEAATKAAEDLLVKVEAMDTKSNEADAKMKEMETAIARMKNLDKDTAEASFKQLDFDAINSCIKASAPNRDLEPVTRENIEIVQKAFDVYMRHGKSALMSELAPEEFKYVNSIVGPQGGFTIPTQSSMQVTPKAFDGRGVLELVNRVTVSTGQYVDYIDEADYDKALYGNDFGPSSDDIDDEGMIELEYNAKEQIYTKSFSRAFLEDSWNPASYYIDQMTQGMTRDTAQGILTGKTVNGTSIQGISGIVEAAEGVAPTRLVQAVDSQNVAGDLSFTWTDTINMAKSLSDRYHANANFAMQRRTFFDLLIEKDNEGRYQTNNFLNFFTGEGSAMSILKYPVVWDAGLADTLTAGNKPVLFGDFQQAYTYIERVGLSVIRDETNPC